MSVFRRASDADAARPGRVQAAMHTEPWPEGATRVRMALHTGEALEREAATISGRPSIGAARLRAIAQPGQIVLSQTTAEIVARPAARREAAWWTSDAAACAATTRDERRLRARAARAAQRSWARRSSASCPRALTAPRGSALIGRSRELDVLDGFGRRRWPVELQVALLGRRGRDRQDPPRGRARGSRVRRGGSCCSAAATRTWRAVPAVRRSAARVRRRPGTERPTELRGATGDLARLVPSSRAATRRAGRPRATQRRSATAVRGGHLAACRRIAAAPVLLVLDDLQWADTPTVLMLRTLVRNATDSPMLVLGTYRDLEVERAHPFADLLRACDRDGTGRRVALRGPHQR